LFHKNTDNKKNNEKKKKEKKKEGKAYLVILDL